MSEWNSSYQVSLLPPLQTPFKRLLLPCLSVDISPERVTVLSVETCNANVASHLGGRMLNCDGRQLRKGLCLQLKTMAECHNLVLPQESF